MNKELRLRRRADFQRVYGARMEKAGPLLSLRFAPNQVGHPRIGFSVSSRLGGAVQRNLLKRRLKAAAERPIQGFKAGVDIVVVARPGATSATYSELESEFRELVGGMLPLLRQWPGYPSS